MPRRKKGDLEELLALPHVHGRDGKAFARIWYRDAGGKWKSKERRVNTVEHAMRVISQMTRELGLRGPEAFDGERMTFNELMDQFLIDNPKTPKWYSDPLREYFASRRIISITYSDLKRFKAAREQVPKKGTDDPRAPKTINHELERLRAVFLYAVRHKWIPNNPFNEGEQALISKAEERSRYRIPSPEEEASILSYCVGLRAHLRPILISAKDTGLRKGALLSLTWSSVDIVVDDDGNDTIGDFLRVPEGNKYKRRPRAIGITARLKAELLLLWEKSDKQPTTSIFGGIQDPKRAYNKACELAGVKDLHFHDWRHGYATDMAEAGIEERIAMIATGHTSAETHAIYTNIDERLARMIASRLDQLHQSRRGGEAVTASE